MCPWIKDEAKHTNFIYFSLPGQVHREYSLLQEQELSGHSFPHPKIHDRKDPVKNEWLLIPKKKNLEKRNDLNYISSHYWNNFFKKNAFLYSRVTIDSKM